MKRMRSRKNIITPVIVVLCCCLLFVAFVFYANWHTEQEYSLSELSEGVYGVYTVTMSSIPAQNYETITLCCNGEIRTFKGNINIRYDDISLPYVVWHDYNAVNGDDVWVCVPRGTIEFQKSVGIF